jgi:hypothetical protein
MGKQIFIVILLILVIAASIGFIAAAPSGGTITSGANETAPVDPPSSISAYAGNVTLVNVYGSSTTQTWQGYFGNVTGVIELTDASNRTMYNWSSTSPTGEVYASNDSGVIWTNIQCLNFTANGTLCAEDSEYRGGTSRCGINETLLDFYYNIGTTSVEGVNETFNRRDHTAFNTNALSFTLGECGNAKIYNSTGQGSFDEVLLYSPDSKAVVFASLLQNNGDGFDGSTHDFEMLVLDDGHGANVAITTYYFYVELQ